MVYAKSVMGEQWDDYQLRSVALGGNQQMFKITKEYSIEKWTLKEKCQHDCMKWYKKMHLARMDDVPFDKMKPPKDFQEGLN